VGVRRPLREGDIWQERRPRSDIGPVRVRLNSLSGLNQPTGSSSLKLGTVALNFLNKIMADRGTQRAKMDQIGARRGWKRSSVGREFCLLPWKAVAHSQRSARKRGG
jgi:hypothetical protein